MIEALCDLEVAGPSNPLPGCEGFLQQVACPGIGAEVRVDAAHRVHQCRLDFGLVRQLRFDQRRAFLEQFVRRDLARPGLAGIGHLEQVHQEICRLQRRFRLGLGAHTLPFRFGASQPCRRGEGDGDDHPGQRGRRNNGHASVAPDLLTLPEFVKTDAEQAGDQLELGVVAAVLTRSGICCDRFRRPRGQAAVSVQFEPQRLGETLLGLLPRMIRRMGFATDDQREDPITSPETLEREDFLVYPSRACGLRRTDHDKRRGLFEGRIDFLAEIRGTRQLLAVPEDRAESRRNYAMLRLLADESFRDGIIFQSPVQSRCPVFVAMAVTYERFVFFIVHRAGSNYRSFDQV